MRSTTRCGVRAEKEHHHFADVRLHVAEVRDVTVFGEGALMHWYYPKTMGVADVACPPIALFSGELGSGGAYFYAQEPLGIPLASSIIHPPSWKIGFRRFACRELHSPAPASLCLQSR